MGACRRSKTHGENSRHRRSSGRACLERKPASHSSRSTSVMDKYFHRGDPGNTTFPRTKQLTCSFDILTFPRRTALKQLIIIPGGLLFQQSSRRTCKPSCRAIRVNFRPTLESSRITRLAKVLTSGLLALAVASPAKATSSIQLCKTESVKFSSASPALLFCERTAPFCCPEATVPRQSAGTGRVSWSRKAPKAA